MEKLANCLTQIVQETKKTQHDNTLCSTHHASNTSFHNVYEMIPKKDYGILLSQLEIWGVGSPKAVCRIYGVKTVQRAVAYVKATPNVKNPGAYFTFMVRQLKKVDANIEQENQNIKKSEPEQNKNIENPKPQSEIKGVKTKKGIFIPPHIENWKQASSFLCNLKDTDLEDEKIYEFAKQLKRKYNFA